MLPKRSKRGHKRHISMHLRAYVNYVSSDELKLAMLHCWGLQVVVGSHERDYSSGAKFYTDGTDVFQNYLYAIIHCLRIYRCCTCRFTCNVGTNEKSLITYLSCIV